MTVGGWIGFAIIAFLLLSIGVAVGLMLDDGKAMVASVIDYDNNRIIFDGQLPGT